MLKLLVFCIAATVAQANFEIGRIHKFKEHDRFVDRTEDYIHLNRLRYEKNLKDFDTKLEHVREYFLAQLDAINLQLDMLIASIDQNENYLNPLAVISDASRHCVTTQRSSIPTKADVKSGIAYCTAEAEKKLTNVWANPIKVRDALENYYTTVFEREIVNCGKNYDTATVNYTRCITLVTHNANGQTINRRKAFDIDMDSAKCIAKSYIKIAWDCSYNFQRDTTSLITGSNLMIEKCLRSDNMCEPCEPSCPNNIIMHLDYKNETILNPFHGRKYDDNCVLITPV